MRNPFVLTFQTICSSAILVIFSQTRSGSAAVSDVGDIARDFTIPNRATGQPIRLNDFAGQIVVLDFFAYWCPPCQQSSPDLEDSVQRYYLERKGNPAGIPVTVIGMNIEAGAPQQTDSFIKNARMTLVLDDLDQTGWNQFNTENAIPLFVIINGTDNSSNYSSWEVMYRAAGYEGAQKFRELIDMVKIATSPVAPSLAAPLTGGTMVVGGAFTFTAKAKGFPTPKVQWLRDGEPIHQGTSATLSFARLAATDSGMYSVVLSNVAGEVTSPSARLRVLEPTPSPGLLDTTYKPSYMTENTMRRLVLQQDGKLVLPGPFVLTENEYRSRLTRLNLDGSLDTGFQTESFPGLIEPIGIQPDGKILGHRVNWDSQDVFTFRVVRFLPNGTTEPGFAIDLAVDLSNVGQLGPPAVSFRKDGKFYLGGDFYQVNGKAKAGLALFELDGSVDNRFNPPLATRNRVTHQAVQNDDKVLVYATALNVRGVIGAGLRRLNLDGSVDLSFSNSSANYHGPLAVQSDGKVLAVMFRFTSDKQDGAYLERLNPDGSKDLKFDHRLDVTPSIIRSIVLQPDGRVVIAGGFSAIGDKPSTYLARLNSDGTLDKTFNENCWIASQGPPYEPGIDALQLQPDGKILIAGAFTSINGHDRQYLARLHGGISAGGSLRVLDRSPDGRFQFQIDGNGYSSVTIETSMNLADWLEVSTHSPANGNITFADPKEANATHRFYRAVFRN